MADQSPNPSQRPTRYCLTLLQDPHRWTFSFTPADAGIIAQRIEELAHDPDAPFDRDAADLVHRHLARIRREAPWPRADAPAADGRR